MDDGRPCFFKSTLQYSSNSSTIIRHENDESTLIVICATFCSLFEQHWIFKNISVCAIFLWILFFGKDLTQTKWSKLKRIMEWENQDLWNLAVLQFALYCQLKKRHKKNVKSTNYIFFLDKYEFFWLRFCCLISFMVFLLYKFNLIQF